MSGPFTAAPPAYLVPSDPDDLATLVRWASAEGVAIVPRAAGTGMPGGNLGPWVTVEIGPGFESLEWVDRDAGLVRAGVGVVAAELERFAADAGFQVPFLPSSRKRCRVGGMVANNAAGARSFRHGAAAAFVERVEGLFASGEPFVAGAGVDGSGPFASLRARLEGDLGVDGATFVDGPDGAAPPLPDWPRVRKNSSGYALDRWLGRGTTDGRPADRDAQLLVGSEGTLAILTAVELRLIPAPERRALVVVAAPTMGELVRIASEAVGIEAETCEFLGRRFLEMAGLDPEMRELARDAEALVLIEVAGSDADVDERLDRAIGVAFRGGCRHVVARTPEDAARLWEVRHAASPTIAREAERGRVSTQFIEDSVVPPASLGGYLEGLDRILADSGLDAVVFGHAGDANVHVNPLVDVAEPAWPDRVRSALDGVADLVAGLGGTLSGEHGDGRLRAPLLDRIWPARLAAAFRAVKGTFDPDGILNPGVVVPLPGQDPLEALRPRVRKPDGERLDA